MDTSLANPQNLSTASVDLQRSTGLIRLSFKERGANTVLDDMYQQGSGKVRMARPENDRHLEAVLINTSGGMTDGDLFSSKIHWQQNTTAIVTTQAAERIYKSRGGLANIQTELTIDNGATALWLPQETIMFDGAMAHRSNHITLAKTARLVAVESCIFGRAAMGEIVRRGRFQDSWQFKCDGKLQFVDRFLLEDNIQSKLDRAAIANGANSMATIICSLPQLQKPFDNLLDQIRAILDNQTCRGGASTIGQLTIIRLFAKSAYELRIAVIEVLEFLLSGISTQENKRFMPRVWSL